MVPMEERGIAPRALVLILIIIIVGAGIGVVVFSGPATTVPTVENENVGGPTGENENAETGHFLYYDNVFDFVVGKSMDTLENEDHAGLYYRFYEGEPRLCYNIVDIGAVSLEAVAEAPENADLYETSVNPIVGHTYCQIFYGDTPTYAKFEILEENVKNWIQFKYAYQPSGSRVF